MTHKTDTRKLSAAALAVALVAAGCSSTTGVTATPGGTVSLSTTQVADASASMEGLSLIDQITDAASASATATGDTGFTISQASARPSPAPSNRPSAPPRGKPNGSVSNTTVSVDSAAGTTSVVQAIRLGGNSTKVNGTNTITRVFTGVVSQTSDVQAALKEIRDKTFALASVKHELSMTNPKGTRTSTRTCTFGAAVTCTTSGESTNVRLASNTTVNKSDRSESGSGTVTHKKSGKMKNLTITKNADGSSIYVITNPGGVTITLNKAADGTVSGTVVKDGQTLATITTDAEGNIQTSDSAAGETSEKAADAA